MKLEIKLTLPDSKDTVLVQHTDYNDCTEVQKNFMMALLKFLSEYGEEKVT